MIVEEKAIFLRELRKLSFVDLVKSNLGQESIQYLKLINF